MEAPISQALAEELWRTGDLRGSYTTKFGDAEELREAALLVNSTVEELEEKVKREKCFRPVDRPADGLPRTLLDLTVGGGVEDRTEGARLAGWAVESAQHPLGDESRAELLRRAEGGSFGAAISATRFPSLSRARKAKERVAEDRQGRTSQWSRRRDERS